MIYLITKDTICKIYHFIGQCSQYLHELTFEVYTDMS